MLRFFVGYIFVILFFLAGWILEGGNPIRLVGPSSFLIAFFVPFFAVISTWTFKEWGKAFSSAFTGSPSREDIRKGVALWLLWERLSYIGGILGFVGGIILILSALPSPDSPFNLNMFGRSIGTALIAPIYGLFLGVFGRIMKTRVEEKTA